MNSMFKKADGTSNTPNKAATSFGAVVGQGMEVEAGRMTGDGDVEITGKYSGRIAINGMVVVGSGAEVYSDIITNHLELGGIVIGNVSVLGNLVIKPTGNMTGNILCEKLVVEDGGVINGKCNMMTVAEIIEVLKEQLTAGTGDGDAFREAASEGVFDEVDTAMSSGTLNSTPDDYSYVQEFSSASVTEAPNTFLSDDRSDAQSSRLPD